jgi:hypothetical protein
VLQACCLVAARSRGSCALSHLQFVQPVEMDRMDRVDREIYSNDFLISRPQRYSGAVHAGQSPATAGPRSCSLSSKASSSSEDDRSSSRSLNGIPGDLTPARQGTSSFFQFIEHVVDPRSESTSDEGSSRASIDIVAEIAIVGSAGSIRVLYLRM